MSEEKKCCGCCNNKELSNEQLDKVTGGFYLKDGKYMCDEPFILRYYPDCRERKTVDGVANVCTCSGKTNGKCHYVYGDNCTCPNYNKEEHLCFREIWKK